MVASPATTEASFANNLCPPGLWFESVMDRLPVSKIQTFMTSSVRTSLSSGKDLIADANVPTKMNSPIILEANCEEQFTTVAHPTIVKKASVAR